MSKVGEKPIIIKEGVSFSTGNDAMVIKGPLGEVKLALPSSLVVNVVDNQVKVGRLKEDKKAKSCHGTIARLIANAIVGTTVGFEKTLEVVGTGYRCQMEGSTLVLSLGYSHPVKFASPEGVKITVSENKIKVFGVDKEKVGIVADKIKRFKKPDPYKGKGIRYEGEKLRLKPGKVAAKSVGPGGK